MTRSPFLLNLEKTAELKPEAIDSFDQAGARTAAAVYALLEGFPSLSAALGLDAPSLSIELARQGGARMQAFLAASDAPWREALPVLEFGAEAPAESEWGRGQVVPARRGDVDAAAGAAVAPPETRVDLRRCDPWPIRDQGRRGTCVAFAVTAIREALDCERHRRIDDLSEQYLYWSVKTSGIDPWPTLDGTLIRIALDRLANDGICGEAHWPYVPTPIPGNPSQGSAVDPSVIARADAPARRASAGLYAAPHPSTGSAARVLGEMQATGRPVAVSLPVFKDPAAPLVTNWTTRLGTEFGIVLDPPRTAVVSGGHAVCLTGFVGDPTEPLGGYFVVRNSWGTALWGRSLPDPSAVGPAPGFGQVSATYIDRYLYEMGRL